MDDRPLLGESAVPFSTPAGLTQEVELPNAGTVRGMAIPRGVTLIVGGGYHGKSTLLRAIERGVYNHCYGDGRESVVTDSSAVKSGPRTAVRWRGSISRRSSARCLKDRTRIHFRRPMRPVPRSGRRYR